MYEDKILAAGFTHNSRIGFVIGDVLPNHLPHILEDRGRPCEMHAGQIPALQNQFADRGTRSGNHIDNSVRQSGFLHHLHDDMGGIDSGRGRFPDHGIAHHGRRGRKVSPDRDEIKRRDRKNKALQGTIFHPVPDHGSIPRLHIVNHLGVKGIIAIKVDQLADPVDLSLEDILGMRQHSGGVHDISVWPGQQIRRFQEDTQPVLVGHIGPFLLGIHGRLNSHLDFLFSALGIFPQFEGMIMRGPDFGLLGCTDLFSSYYHWNVNRIRL